MPSAGTMTTPPHHLSFAGDAVEGQGEFSASEFRVLHALTDHVCVLDASGTLLAVNQAWRDFAVANPPLSRQTDVGANYFAVCEAATGEEAWLAQAALRGLRTVAEGGVTEFVMEYPCHSPTTRRWFELRGTRLRIDGSVRLVVAHRNVTQRKEAELALRLQGTIVHSMAEGVCVVRCCDEAILYANPKFQQMFGCGPGPMDELLVARVNHETGTKSAAEVIRQIVAELAGSGQVTWDVQYVPKDRGPFWCRVRASRSEHPEHGPVVVTFHEDVTERRLAEASLRASEERFRAIADYTADLECWFGPDGRLIWISPSVERITGYTVAECLAMPGFPSPLFPADEVARNNASFNEALGGSQNGDWEFRFIRKDGAERWGSVAWQPIQSADGTRLGHRSSVRDITERKRAEQALRHAHDRLRQQSAQLSEERHRLFYVLEALPVMVCLLAPDHHVIFANRAFREKFGESNGRHCYEYRCGYDTPCPFCETFIPLKTGRPHRWEFTSPDGGTVIDAHDFPFTDSDGSPLILEMDFDITERKRFEAEHAAALARLAMVEEQERQRISRELHDQTAQWLVALALELKALETNLAAGHPQPERVRSLRKAVDELQEQVRAIIWDLRAGELVEDLERALRDYVEDWSERTSVSAECECRGLGGRRLPARVESTLYRVAQEALANVEKHAQAQHVSVLLERDALLVRLTVEDDGRGFDVDACQGAPETERLGLLGMKERVALAGGTFLIESSPGAGTTILVRIPMPTEARRS